MVRSPSPSWGGTAKRSGARVGNASSASVVPGFRLPHPDRYAIVPPHFGGGRTTAHGSSPPVQAVGEGAGRPGLARCCCVVTVSTKQTCPAQPFSTRHPAGGPCFGPCRITADDIAASDAGGTWRSQQSAPLARGEQAEAIHRPPQGPPGYPSPGLHRSTTARRHRGAGSDALPTDGMGRSLTRVPAMMADDAVKFERREESAGWWSRIC